MSRVRCAWITPPRKLVAMPESRVVDAVAAAVLIICAAVVIVLLGHQ
ncbi:hypothetical protein [Streptomyces roseicoloratus]|uniref:Uncharacterized protein n=1 Tax=Streptomyces roseicoloratus TaxID=2508722 RepID=A0ABY9RWE7_9ACTN|nr:hypothetical protein [Streptomyces roseicoloratus]WMX46492.1 hypothetical protein RGF97_18880 [Streptomyces roseicoloratus]